MLRKFERLVSIVAAAGLAAVTIGAGTASAATNPKPETMAGWQASVSRLATPGAGCYRTSFPSLQWHAVKCSVAPEMPLVPEAASVLRGGPNKLGDGKDYSAEVSGLISSATGTFTGVSSKITEKGQIGGTGSELANEFTLQLNTQFFSGSTACDGASNPSKCQAWQQFVYETDINQIFMQYWLIDYDATCPSDWFTYSKDCYTNSASATVSGTSRLTAKDLADVSLTGSAASAGDDSVSISLNGTATAASGNDTKVDLASHWIETEWGVFGDGGGGEAYFGNDTMLTAVTSITGSSSGAPTCVKAGYTGETNNLDLAATPTLEPGSSPEIASHQTNKDPGTASCSAAA